MTIIPPCKFHASRGTFQPVTDEEMLATQDQLAREGVFAEPAPTPATLDAISEQLALG